MSENMVERVAKAIAGARNDRSSDNTNGGPHPGGTWLDQGEPWWHGDLEVARAAIEGMREPTKEMWSAGTTAIEETRNFTADSYEEYEITQSSDFPVPCWQAMIDAALFPAIHEE